MIMNKDMRDVIVAANEQKNEREENSKLQIIYLPHYNNRVSVLLYFNRVFIKTQQYNAAGHLRPPSMK